MCQKKEWKRFESGWGKEMKYLGWYKLWIVLGIIFLTNSIVRTNAPAWLWLVLNVGGILLIFKGFDMMEEKIKMEYNC